MMKTPIKALVKRQLSKEATKADLVATINTKIDLPKLDEAEEKKLMDGLYDSVVEALILAIDRI